MKKVSLREGVKLLNKGELVIVPTETVYGLVADALNPNAVKQIFLTKERSLKKPLIVLINHLDMMEDLVNGIPDEAVLLMNKFWPGPLTLLFNKTELLPNIVTGGLPTVCIRMPDNKLTLEVIKKLKKPIVASSANISGRSSPMRLEDIKLNLPIIDGGICKYGVESTILSLITDVPTILRSGPISKEQLEIVLGFPIA